MRKHSVEFWTMFTFTSLFGTSGAYSICSRHKTYAAAVRNANACEKAGGNPHDIYRVEKMPRQRAARRRG